MEADRLQLDADNLSRTIAVTWAGDGTIKAESSNTDVATASVNGNMVTVTAQYTGECDITISVADTVCYVPPQDVVIHVTADVASKTLSENSPETIQKIARSGLAANIWSVGDKVPIAIKGTVGYTTINDTYYAFIIGFNHNSEIEGGNSIHFQFGKDSSGKDIAFVSNYGGESMGFVMNNSSTNAGGWKSSYMRKTICPAFLAALPAEWQNVIVACTKYSDNTGCESNTASYVTATKDKIWLLAEYEAFGTRHYANRAEQNYQQQYDYYKNGNSRIKYKHDNTSMKCTWWLRSVVAEDVTNFVYVDSGGAGASRYANNSEGFAPGFMVA